MRGAIRKREILAHPIVTVQCFGWPVFLRALVAGRESTFLSLLTDTGAHRPRRTTVPELLTRCTALEERAQKLYSQMAGRFVDVPAVARLFEGLSIQEEEHAELLRVCGVLAATVGPEAWHPRNVEHCRYLVDRAERRLGDEEAKVDKVVTVADGLRAAIRVEASEINDAFAAAIEASDSAFVHTLDAFRSAEDEHRKYLYRQIEMLAPELSDEARPLLRTK